MKTDQAHKKIKPAALWIMNVASRHPVKWLLLYPDASPLTINIKLRLLPHCTVLIGHPKHPQQRVSSSGEENRNT